MESIPSRSAAIAGVLSNSSKETGEGILLSKRRMPEKPPEGQIPAEVAEEYFPIRHSAVIRPGMSIPHSTHTSFF